MYLILATISRLPTIGIDRVTVHLRISKRGWANLSTITHSFLHSPTLEAISVSYPADLMQRLPPPSRVEQLVSGLPEKWGLWDHEGGVEMLAHALDCIFGIVAAGSRY